MKNISNKNSRHLTPAERNIVMREWNKRNRKELIEITGDEDNLERIRKEIFG